MVEFNLPNRTQVNISKAFEKLWNCDLIKDLRENEKICPVCGGTGIVVVENPYGLKNDPNYPNGVLPYKNYSISFCKNCYNGVIHVCPDCGQQIPRGYLKCSCAAEQERQNKQAIKVYMERLANAEKHAPSALGDEFDCAYYDQYERNDGYFYVWDEFFDWWKDSYDSSYEKPEYVWGTTKIHMRLNANDIISSACEDLYEDADSNISSVDIKEMQDFFDKWLKEHGLTAYEFTYQHAIRIPWEETNDD